jgi:hypothetical protein
MQRNSIRPACKYALYGSLIVSGAMLITSILWIYSRVHHSLGLEVAEVAMAFMSILILVLIGVGVRTGSQLDQLIREGQVEDCVIYQSFTLVRKIVIWLGYQEKQPEKEVPTPPNAQNAADLLALMEKPRKRGGRHPTHPLDKWTRVVVAWEKHDHDRYPINLNEFLCEHFGRNADGSPGMSENSFYANKKRVLAELQRQATEKNFSEN